MPGPAVLPIAGKALSFLPTIYQGITALNQNNLGKKLKKSDYIPPGVRESVNIARSNANATTLPGQDRTEENLEKQTSNTVSAAQRSGGDSTSVVDTVQKADLAGKKIMGDLGKMVADFRFENSRALGRALERKGMYEQANQDKYDAAKSALRGSSQQNFFNFLSNAASGVQSLTSAPEKQDENLNTQQNDYLTGPVKTRPGYTGPYDPRRMQMMQDYFMRNFMPDPTRSLNLPGN